MEVYFDPLTRLLEILDPPWVMGHRDLKLSQFNKKYYSRFVLSTQSKLCPGEIGHY